MLIRSATTDDVSAIARIHVDVWQSTYGGTVPQGYLDSLSYQVREEMWMRVIEPEHPTTLFVAEESGQVLGFVSVGPERNNTRNGYTGNGYTGNGYTGIGELFTLYVSDIVQRRGMGSLLFLAGAAHLRNLGFKSMILWVLEDNTKGIAFYEKMGGKRTGSKMIEVHNVQLKELRYEFTL